MLKIRHFLSMSSYNQKKNNKEESTVTKIINKGTGAGGANTTKNGHAFEDKCNLANCILTKKFGKGKNDFYDVIKIENKLFKRVFKTGLKNYLKKYFEDKWKKNLQPDECLIDEDNKILYILEKKYQQRAGSVDEKIQTGDCKIFIYRHLYPQFKINFIYILSDFYKKSKYTLEKMYLEEKGVIVFYGDDSDYKCKFYNYIRNVTVVVGK